MKESDRGVLYIIWGDKAERGMERSVASLRQHHPELPVHVVRVSPAPDPARGLLQKAKMGSLTPFRTTLYLDADTVVLGNLEFAFQQAEEFGLACSICECPWLRRYTPPGGDGGDAIEYNTGVLFFSEKSREVFKTWESIAPMWPARGQWASVDGQVRGVECDDQASFGRAIQVARWNPFVLPLNYNLRPGLQHRFFAPLKIWHDYGDVPPPLLQINAACESGQRPVTYIELLPDQKPRTP